MTVSTKSIDSLYNAMSEAEKQCLRNVEEAIKSTMRTQPESFKGGVFFPLFQLKFAFRKGVRPNRVSKETLEYIQEKYKDIGYDIELKDDGIFFIKNA